MILIFIFFLFSARRFGSSHRWRRRPRPSGQSRRVQHLWRWRRRRQTEQEQVQVQGKRKVNKPTNKQTHEQTNFESTLIIWDVLLIPISMFRICLQWFCNRQVWYVKEYQNRSWSLDLKDIVSFGFEATQSHHSNFQSFQTFVLLREVVFKR